jgi:hypothetical protein
MANVKVFLGRGEHPDWNKIGKALTDKGVDVCTGKATADVSIVLSGHGTNTLCLTGKKVLVYSTYEWMRGVQPPLGFDLFKPVLDEYYDDFINLTGIEMKDAADKIIKYIRGLDV